jgi:hypothetical protein
MFCPNLGAVLEGIYKRDTGSREETIFLSNSKANQAPPEREYKLLMTEWELKPEEDLDMISARDEMDSRFLFRIKSDTDVTFFFKVEAPIDDEQVMQFPYTFSSQNWQQKTRFLSKVEHHRTSCTSSSFH